MITNAVSTPNMNFSAPSNKAVGDSSSSTGSERDLFMTLLVAQLKNQDPLAPQDGAQFVAQLAQFNSLDQLVGIRQSIEQLTALLNKDQQPADA
jgi:flagellar basal-body rod modification protein FlgD